MKWTGASLLNREGRSDVRPPQLLRIPRRRSSSSGRDGDAVTKVNDGGRAFPSPADTWPEMRGMKLRDWFAGKADISGFSFPGHEHAAEWLNMPVPTNDDEALILSTKIIARIRYLCADAMLAERERQP